MHFCQQGLLENSLSSIFTVSQGNLWTRSDHFQVYGKAGGNSTSLEKANTVTVFKRGGKKTSSRLVFRKALVSKSQESIMCPKLNTKIIVHLHLKISGYMAIFSQHIHRCNCLDWYITICKNGDQHNLRSLTCISYQFDKPGPYGRSRSLGLQQESMHGPSSQNLSQAGTTWLTLSLRLFLFLHIYFSLPQDTN